MGYYYEHSQDERFGKAEDLIKMHNGKVVSSDYVLNHDEALFCVVNNGPFEAAAFCFNSDERARFNRAQDTRPKTWVVIPMSELPKAVPLLQNKDEAEKQRQTAQGEADSRLAIAKAEAEAIRIKGDALRDNPKLVELNAVERWNGILPTMMLGGGAVPFISVPTTEPK